MASASRKHYDDLSAHILWPQGVLLSRLNAQALQAQLGRTDKEIDRIIAKKSNTYRFADQK